MSVEEEALIEELVYLLGHIAHAEQHAIEIDSGLREPRLYDVINKLRVARKKAGRILLEEAGLVSAGGDGEFRTGGENIWCTIKHLSMALIHCDECIEKTIKRLLNGRSECARGLLALYETRKTILDVLKRVFEEGRAVEGVDAVRCREDLCVEE